MPILGIHAAQYFERNLLRPRSLHGALYGVVLACCLCGALAVLMAPQPTLILTFSHVPLPQELLAWKVVGASLLLPVWLCVPLKVSLILSIY